MRLRSSFAIALAAALVAAPCFGQSSFSLAAGAAVPVMDGLNLGYNATLSLTVKPPLARVGLRIEGMFNSFTFQNAPSSDASQRVLGLTGGVTISGAGTPIPRSYLVAGLGAYQSQVTGVPAATDPNNELGFHVGVGMTLSRTGFNTFLEARYHHVPLEGGAVRFVPIVFGLKF